MVRLELELQLMMDACVLDSMCGTLYSTRLSKREHYGLLCMNTYCAAFDACRHVYMVVQDAMDVLLGVLPPWTEHLQSMPMSLPVRSTDSCTFCVASHASMLLHLIWYAIARGMCCYCIQHVMLRTPAGSAAESSTLSCG